MWRSKQKEFALTGFQPPIPAVSLPSSGNTALLLLLCMQHSFPEPSSLYLELILAVLALELICSLSCLLLYAGESGSLCPVTSACLSCHCRHSCHFSELPSLAEDSFSSFVFDI